MEKNKKKITILHPTAYLTSPNKPKIQHVDREAIKDLCDIAMEFLVHDENYENRDAIKEYKSYVEDQDRLASFDLFPGVRGFQSDILTVNREDVVQAMWSNEIRLKATGSARTLMDIISYTLTDFSSNCKQHSTNNHERTPFVKYIVPMFKYFKVYAHVDNQFLKYWRSINKLLLHFFLTCFCNKRHYIRYSIYQQLNLDLFITLLGS